LVKGLRELGFCVEAYGAGWPGGSISYEKMAELTSRAKVVLGMGGVMHTDRVHHLKGRDFEVPMAGAVYLTSFNAELADHFAIGSEILCYSSLEECAEILAHTLRDPVALTRIGEAARKRCLQDHTWEGRVHEMLEIVRG
jgi:spore maturation protein CgeB